MAVLKKIKASTLMETLIATVLIVIIFMLSSMILNNLFYNSIRNNTNRIESHYNEVRYFYSHGKISIPYYDDYEGWEISVGHKNESMNLLEFHAFKKETGQNFTKYINEN